VNPVIVTGTRNAKRANLLVLIQIFISPFVGEFEETWYPCRFVYYARDGVRTPDWLAAFKKLSLEPMKFLPRSPANASSMILVQASSGTPWSANL
jgi:hypothetical protein